MLVNQQQFHLVRTKSNTLLSSCSNQLATNNRNITWELDYFTYLTFLVCSLQPKLPRAMCIRIHQLFFLSVGVVAGRAREQYSMNHAKNPMEGLQYLSSNACGMKFSSMNNLVWKINRMQLVGQPNAGGAVEILAIWPTTSQKLKISSVQKITYQKNCKYNSMFS